MSSAVDKISNFIWLSIGLGGVGIYAIFFSIIRYCRFDQNKHIGKIQLYNIVVGFLHLITAIFMLVRKPGDNGIKEYVDDDNNLTVEFNEDETTDRNKGRNKGRTTGENKRLLTSWMMRFENDNGEHIYPYKISVQQLCAIFSYITAFFHFVLGSGYFFKSNTFYIKLLNNNLQWMRWLEYSITYTIMMISLANVSSLYNVSLLLCIATLSILTIVLGLIIDVLNSKNYPVNRSALILAVGFIPFFVTVWAIVNKYLTLAREFVDDGPGNFPENPEFTEILEEYAQSIGILVGVIFTMFNFFPAIQLASLYTSDSIAIAEVLYISSSLISKLFLNYSIYFSGNRPNFTGDPDGNYIEDNAPSESQDEATEETE